ncbi:MAG: hypothetical protein OXN90_05655 [Gemmatimonadota bacterium]|nr:hypothetical protein [Gemmatimonadota bacterium]
MDRAVANNREWPASARDGLLFAAVVFSGAGGLIYQLAWTRWLASITSATHTAQAVVLAVFMAGLALGAYLGGRVGRCLSRPLLAYAGVEAVAALLAALSILLIPASHGVRALAAATGLWLQLAALAAFLLLPTTLLGASLPLLIQFLDRGHSAAQKRRTARLSSLLYGWNTIGATVGCLVAGYATIEFLGLAQTIYCGMSCATVAATIAAALQSRALEKLAVTPAEEMPANAGVAWLGAACLAGFTGLGAEVLWTRLVSLIIPTTVYALAQVLAAVLLGIALGAGVAASLIRRTKTLAALQQAASLLLATGAVGLAAVPVALLGIAGNLALELELSTGFGPEFGLLLLILAPPAGLLGAILPILVAVRRQRSSAKAFGDLYAANTIGGVVGSLVMGFGLLPLLGSEVSTAVLVAGTAALSVWFMAGTRASGKSWFAAVCLYAVASLLIATVDIPRDLYRARLAEDTAILEFREGSTSDVMVTEDGDGVRRLWINSSWVAANQGGHRILGHLPALFVTRPEQVLGIALGTGQTFASIMQHGVEELYCVELDAGVIELSVRWFSQANNGLLQKPQVVLHQDDGRAFMRATDRQYDLIILEPLQAWSVGTTNLYTVEFYREAHAILHADGVLAQWVPFYGQSVRDTRSMVRSAMQVFPQASLWLDDRDGILLLSKERFVLEPTRLKERIDSRGVRPYLALNDAGEVPDLLSLFLLGPEALKSWTAGAPLISDDHPFLEFSAARHLGTSSYRRILTAVFPVLDDPGQYLASTEKRHFGTLAKARAIRRAALRARELPPGDFAGRAAVLERGLAAVPQSHLLRKRYRDLLFDWAAAVGGTSNPVAAEGMYRRGLQNAPGMTEVSIQLAILQGEQGRFAEALSVLNAARTAFDARASGSPDLAASLQDSMASVRRQLLAAERAGRDRD